MKNKHTAAETTIFSVMTALSNTENAINLSQGFPDFPIDPALVDLLAQASADGHNQYSPMPGHPLLRQAIADNLKARSGLDVDSESEITITPGATYGIYTALLTILEPGDEVIFLEPAYDSYKPNIEMCGAVPVPVPLLSPSFSPDWDAIKSAISPKTKAIIVNTPNNPTGAIWAKADWGNLEAILDGTGIYIISDEVYEHLVYDNATHHSVLAFPALRERAFAIYSFGKAFHITGWKMGYVVAPPALSKAFRRLHQFIGFSVNTPAQVALANYINSIHGDAASMLQAKRDFFLDLMKDSAFTFPNPAAGSYFQLASYEGISNLPDTEFTKWLTTEHKVATIPVSAFYTDGKDDKLIRFCFAKKEETLRQAAEKLRSL